MVYLFFVTKGVTNKHLEYPNRSRDYGSINYRVGFEIPSLNYRVGGIEKSKQK